MKKITALILVGLMLLTLAACEEDEAVTGDTYLTMNPYEDVDWENDTHMPSSLHTHTNHSDGAGSPAEVIDLYASEGYGALALTDHDYMLEDGMPIAYPWTDFASIRGDWDDRDPEAAGMIDIPGVEYSEAHHFVGIWTDFLPDYHENDFDTEAGYIKGIMDDIMEGDPEALMFMAHPGRYTDDEYPVPDEGKFSLPWYQDLYDAHESLLGMEVFNGSNSHAFDRHLWDQLLLEYMPERPVWGFAADDFHGDSLERLGLSTSISLMADVSDEAAFRQGLAGGRFYVQHTRTPRGYAPMVGAVDVDETRRTITLDVEGEYDRIKWYGGYDYEGGAPELVETGDTFQYNDFEGPYVRVEVVYDEGGFEHAETVLQPFGFTRDPAREE